MNEEIEMSKKTLGAVPLVYPIPIVLVGSMVNDRANFTEVGDCAVMGINPALVTISLAATHHSTGGVDAHGEFSINFPNTDLIAKADYCGIVSGRDVDKSRLFTVFAGELAHAPLIEECPVGLECRVLETVQIKHRRIFIAEVVQCHIDETYVEACDDRKSVASLRRLDPLIYALDNRYYKIGDPIGTGYAEGRSLD